MLVSPVFPVFPVLELSCHSRQVSSGVIFCYWCYLQTSLSIHHMHPQGLRVAMVLRVSSILRACMTVAVMCLYGSICPAQSTLSSVPIAPPGPNPVASVIPGDILAGPAPLQGSSALGCCYLPAPNPWGTAAVLVVELFSPVSWAYDALTLEPIGTIPHPSPGSTTTGITTDGNSLYWGILAPPGPSQLWRTDLDGSNSILVGSIGLQVTSFVGGLAWDGDDGIWAVDIAGEQYDRISIDDGSYLGPSVLHPDTAGAGNGVAFRSDCGHLEIPHGSDFAGRVTTISTVNPLTDVPLAPLEVASIGFFINGIESSRPAVAPAADPYGVYSIWIVDNSSNNLFAIEGRSQCPEELPPIDGFSCNADVSGNVQVTWDANPGLETVEIRIDGLLAGTTSGSAGQWFGASANFPDVILVQVCGHTDQQWTPTRSCELLIPGCAEGVYHLSHLSDPDTINDAVPVCTSGIGHTAQSYWRIYEPCQFPFNLPTGLELKAVRIAIKESDPGPGSVTMPLLLRLHHDPDGGSINPISSLQLLHEQLFQVPQINGQHLCLNLIGPVEVDCNTTLVVEIALLEATVEEHLLELGSNATPETAEGWHSAPSCGIGQPTPFSDLGYSATHVGIDLIGDPLGTHFIRGDTNGDSARNLTDAIWLLEALFLPGNASLDCADSGDCNDDGGMDLADAIFLLSYLFIPNSPHPPPPEACGADLTASDPLECDIFPGCP